MILSEARELCRKQDDQLRSWKLLSKGIAAGVVSAGAIVIAAAGRLGDTYAAVTFLLLLILVVLAALVEVLCRKWVPGPKMKMLKKYYEDGVDQGQDLEEELFKSLIDQYETNRERLFYVKLIVAVQAAATLAFAGIVLWQLLYGDLATVQPAS